MKEDKELVASILSGKKQAFRQLITQYQRLVFHMASRIIQNDTELEDLCQDIFIKVYQQLPTFRFQSKLSTWIATIAYHSAISYAKKKKILTSEMPGQIEEHFAVDPEQDNLFRREDMKELVHQQIEKLPAHYRNILTLYHLEGMSYPEIGEITGLPAGTVKNYLFRARKLLKEKLEIYLPKGELI